MRNSCCHLVCTPSGESAGKPVREVVEGWKRTGGRKKRVIAPEIARKKPAMLAHTIKRRTSLTEGSGRLCTRGPAAGGFEGGFATAVLAIPALTEGVGVEVVLEAPEAGATRAAGGGAAGAGFAGGGAVGAGGGGGGARLCGCGGRAHRGGGGGRGGVARARCRGRVARRGRRAGRAPLQL